MKNSNTLPAPQSLSVKAVTWSRDSHGLYDYESRNVQKRMLQTSNSCYLYRVGTDIQQALSLSDSKLAEDSTALCFIEQENSEFCIKPHSEPLWMVVRTLKNKFGAGHVLNEGDVIKLGRVCFKVATLRSNLESVSSENTQDSEESDCEIPNERENGVCRICLYDDSDSQNPLISPCSCSGSMRYIHLGCLQQWLTSRMISRNTENCMTYSWKSIDCEICKTTFPFSLGGSGENSELFKIEKPNTPYIVLEGIGSDKNSNRGVHIVSVTSNNNITLGRGHDADVRISDISVSRCHATIRFREGCFVVEDNNSKFGTLVKGSEKIQVRNSGGSLVLQIGRTVISLSTKPQGNNFDLSEITN